MSHSINWFLWGPFGGFQEGGSVKLYQNICRLHIYWYKKKLTLKVEAFKKSILGVHLERFQGEWYPKLSKYLSPKHLLISKITNTLSWAVQKIDFSRVRLGDYRGGGGGSTPKLYQNICLANICWLKKRNIALAWNIQKTDFLGIFGSLRRVVPQTMSKYLFFKYLLIKIYKYIALAWAVQKLIFGVHFRERNSGGWNT